MKKIELSIPTPCHENWNAMTPEDKGRFCAACQKTVVDFTAMSDAQIAQFFKKPAGSVCGRFEDSQLNRVVEVPRKRLPWIKYFFSIALPALLFSKKAAAQGEVRRIVGKVSMCNKPSAEAPAKLGLNTFKQDTTQPESIRLGFVSAKIKVQPLKTLHTRVKNEKGDPVPLASVFAKEEGRAAVADSTGAFAIKYLKLPLALEISSIGYQTKTLLYNGENKSEIVLQSSEHSYATLGVVAVAAVRKKSPVSERATPKKTETPAAKFSVYPNPVSAESSFTIDAKSLEGGLYKMQLLGISGELIQSRELAIQAKGKQSVALGAMTAGSYFVRLTSKKDNKSCTEVLLVR